MHFSLKASSEQMNALTERLSKRVKARWSKAEKEGRKVLDQLGAQLDAEDHSLKAVVSRLRSKNPTLRVLARNLDVATYDLRGRINWDLTMMSAYAKLQAEKAYRRDIKPRIDHYTEQLEDSLKTLKEKLH